MVGTFVMLVSARETFLGVSSSGEMEELARNSRGQ